MSSAGSSPRVRGTVRGVKWYPAQMRFIPACAGNRRGYRRRHPKNAVHPRVCGEQNCTICSSWDNGGSSPRVRGTETQESGHNQYPRFIPAYAGNSVTAKRPAEPPPVHPRVCGEQLDGPGRPGYLTGSSPRVRGTEPVLTPSRTDPRFIPACAGNR